MDLADAWLTWLKAHNLYFRQVPDVREVYVTEDYLVSWRRMCCRSILR